MKINPKVFAIPILTAVKLALSNTVRIGIANALEFIFII